MLFPVVTLEGRPFMDGGLLSHVNATSAPPTDVLVVLSCHPLGATGGSAAGALTASEATANAELARLRDYPPDARLP